MNGVRVLTMNSAASGDRAQRSFLSDVSVDFLVKELLETSPHSSEHYSLISYTIDAVCGSNVGV